MPRTSRATRRRPEADPLDDNTATAVMEPALDGAFVTGGELFTPFNQEIPFFRALSMMTDADWERCVIYLYRIDPKVRNPEGSKKYIDKLGMPIDEDFIKESHGGGKYLAILRDDSQKNAPLSRSHIFEIDGPAKFLAGQTAPAAPGGAAGVLQPPAPQSAAAPQETSRGEIASIIREVLHNNQKPDPNSQAVIETMTTAYRAGIEVMKTASVREANSTTGNPLMDKLLDRLIESSIKGNDAPRDSRMDKLMDLAVARLLDPPQQQNAKDPLEQLGFVKDLLGIDNIGELFTQLKGGGGPDWRTELLKPLGSLAANLPALLSFFAQQSNINFQRQLALIEARRNGLGSPAVQQLQPPAADPFAQPATMPPGVAGTPPGVPGMAPQLDLTQLMLTDIVVAFDNGIEGHVTARMLRDKYPALVEQFKPLLANEQNVMMFAQATPPLNQIATEPEFAEFMKEFCGEVLNPVPDETPETPPAA